MEKIRTSLLIAALFAGLTLLAACEKKEAPPAPAPQVEAPAPAPAEQPATEQAEPTDAASDEAPAAPAEPLAAGSFPPDCEAYLAQMNECANNPSVNAADADALKQHMDQSRASWARLPDQGALGAACRQASQDFSQRAREMGC
ncbi:MAG: hypothetical protein FWC38_09930 [Proteobacteria bacterium]|nr:hypothetical protein [Pseudomonadota bacterium]MCL2308516.1 hypothetical protein [Pseudomonadota bacterium]